MFGQLEEGLVIDSLATVKVELFQRKWIDVISNDLHSLLARMLAIAQ